MKTYDDYILELKNCNSGDIEIDHGTADHILCEFLRSLGYSYMVDEYEKIDKWYA